jgi:hypothetical protein
VVVSNNRRQHNVGSIITRKACTWKCQNTIKEDQRPPTRDQSKRAPTQSPMPFFAYQPNSYQRFRILGQIWSLQKLDGAVLYYFPHLQSTLSGSLMLFLANLCGRSRAAMSLYIQGMAIFLEQYWPLSAFLRDRAWYKWAYIVTEPSSPALFVYSCL